MTADGKLSAAGLVSLIREREELLEQLEVMRANRERELTAARHHAFEAAAKLVEDLAEQSDATAAKLGRDEFAVLRRHQAVYLRVAAKEIRGLKGAPQ